MSFSADVKKELCNMTVSKRCCALAECYGILLYANLFTTKEIRIVTSNEDFAKRLPQLFSRAFRLPASALTQRRGGKQRIFTITDSKAIETIFLSYGYEMTRVISHHINLAKVEETCCKIAFMRGAFLAGGSVIDPNKRYHLELVTAHRSVSREVYAILLELGFAPKDSARNGNYIIYFKQSESIEDFLTTLGASVSAMAIMSAKIEKDMRNAVNRRVNCDSANADKIVQAAQDQLVAIRKIERTAGLESMPSKLQDAALLRIANPDVSLTDLAALSTPPVSKSCMSHRMRNILKYADEC